MKAVRSEKLKEIINEPVNRNKFRQFIATRNSSTGQFVTTNGTSTTVTFVVEKTDAGNKK